MVAGQIQLVSRNYQDLYLNHKPQITFFKLVYHKYSNFSHELIPLLFNNDIDFGQKVSCKISNNGDLIYKIYLNVILPSIPKSINKFAWVKKIGYLLIKNTELEINNKIIDKHYSDWFNIWHELIEERNTENLNKMIGNIPELYEYTNKKDSYELFIPLRFWFCNNIGLALPLIAIYLNNIKINIEFNTLENLLKKSSSHYITIRDNVCNFKQGDIIYQGTNKDKKNIFYDFDYNTQRLYYTKYINFEPMTDTEYDINYDENGYFNNNIYTELDNKKIYNDIGYFVYPTKDSPINNIIEYPTNININKGNLLVNYIYLNNNERKKYLNSTHEYLIDLLQFRGQKFFYNNNFKIKSGFSQMSKEIYFTSSFKNIKLGVIKDYFNYTNNINNKGTGLFKEIKILFNGVMRNNIFNDVFYNYINSYNYHSKNPSNGLYSYSFSLNPESSQPSGSCNFSKIDDISFIFSTNDNITHENNGLLNIYNNYYNILRIKDGMCGIMFSN